MDENITHAFAIFAATFLFVIALSCAMYSYNTLNIRADFYFGNQSTSGYRGDATSTLLDPDEMKRKADFAEVCIAITDIPRIVSTARSSSYNVIVSAGGNVASYAASGDADDINSRIVVARGVFNEEYNLNDEGELQDFLEDLSALVFDPNPSGISSNDLLRSVSSLYEDTTFSIEHTENSITYSKN